MPTLKVFNVPTEYFNGSPGTRAINVLLAMGLRVTDSHPQHDDDDGATISYTIPEGWVDPGDVEERLAKVGLARA